MLRLILAAPTGLDTTQQKPKMCYMRLLLSSLFFLRPRVCRVELNHMDSLMVFIVIVGAVVAVAVAVIVFAVFLSFIA